MGETGEIPTEKDLKITGISRKDLKIKGISGINLKITGILTDNEATIRTKTTEVIVEISNVEIILVISVQTTGSMIKELIEILPIKRTSKNIKLIPKLQARQPLNL